MTPDTPALPPPVQVLASHRAFWKSQAYKIPLLLVWGIGLKLTLERWGVPPKVWGWLIAVPFGLIVWEYVRQLLRDKVVLTIDREGITDMRASHTIPWEYIEGVWSDRLQVGNYSTGQGCSVVA